MACPCTTIRSLDGLHGMDAVRGLAERARPMADWATFDTAVRRVIALEGGRVDHPSDPGGRTAYGITQGTYNAWRRRMGKPRADVFDIPMVEVRSIYYDNYWLPAGVWGLPADLALIHFDTAVNFGVGTSRRMLAESGGTVDGYDRVRRDRREDIIRRKPTMRVFARGWKRRDDAILAAARTAPGGTTPKDIATADRRPPATPAPPGRPRIRPEWA